jgi:hypothetical protein
MGTWGPGNLDSDGALDELATRSAELVTQLWTRAQTKESWQADEWDHDALFVDFEILFALEEGGLLSSGTLPPPTEVDPVRDRWLAGWDAYIDELHPQPGFKEERRAVIAKTFARFRSICAKHHEDD